MFEHLSKLGSDNSFWGTNQGSQVSQQKLMTNGMTSGGADKLVKGSLPTNPVDKLKVANAYGSEGNTVGGVPSTQGLWKDAWRNMPSINDPDWIKSKPAGRIDRVSIPRMPQRSGQHSTNAGSSLFSGAKALLGRLF